MKKTLTTLVVGLFNLVVLHGQSAPLLPQNTSAGKCYEKCLAPPMDSTYTEPTYTYKTVREKKIVVPAHTRWVEKKDKNCVSTNPQDCIATCLETVPAKYRYVRKRIKVETPTKNSNLKPLPKTDLEDYKEQWVQVICKNDLSRKRVKQIKQTLIRLGYKIDAKANSSSIDSSTLNALIDFQKSNNLPIGVLDVFTLNMLEINF